MISAGRFLESPTNLLPYYCKNKGRVCPSQSLVDVHTDHACSCISVLRLQYGERIYCGKVGCIFRGHPRFDDREFLDKLDK